MTDREVWAQRFRRFCQKIGLSQRALAERAGVSNASIAYWQSGRTIPDVLDLERLSRGLNLPRAVVLYETGLIDHGQSLYELLAEREAAGLPPPWEENVAEYADHGRNSAARPGGDRTIQGRPIPSPAAEGEDLIAGNSQRRRFGAVAAHIAFRPVAPVPV